MKPQTVTRDKWLDARVAFLAKEKEFTKARDALSAARRNLPRVLVDQPYTFEGADGSVSFDALFGSKSQLIVYHFMFGADWEEGCPSCSFWADNFDGVGIHLAHRDASLVAVSTASYAKLDAYRTRLGWSFPWYSAAGSGFNADFAVTFSAEQVEEKSGTYNYREGTSSTTELAGISVFSRDPDGSIYHTYSTYGRGLDMLNGAYHYMDLLPKGRNEDDLPHTMAWLRRNDAYDD